jgi:Kef-type K+ transport system membrane component KefB
MPSSAEILLHLYLQIAVILIVCRIVAYGLRYLGQTQVVGEMVAGVLLGPSLFGLLAPAAQQWLFPATLLLTSSTGATVKVNHPSMTILYTIGQLGLVLYMFLVGSDFNTKLVSKHLREAGVISIAGVVVPILVGGYLGYMLSSQIGLFGGQIQPWQAALFLASAMSITAFPVLARIITDLGLTRTKVGTLAIGAAASEDAVAWCLLAIVLASVSNSPIIAALAIGGGVAYALLMIFVGRRALVAFDRVRAIKGSFPQSALVILLFILLLCAAFTDGVGIHSIFGAFIFGAVMPRGAFLDEARRSIERLVMAIIVPIFFVYSGLNTHLDLLAHPALLGTALIVIALAFVAKGGSCFAASWLNGTGVRAAAAIGVLMNARGLMELILINIGLDRGIISTSLFSILVLMTIVTTMVAAPVFRLVYFRGAATEPIEPTAEAAPAASVSAG